MTRSVTAFEAGKRVSQPPNGNGVQRPHPGERPDVVRCNDGLAGRSDVYRLLEAAQRPLSRRTVSGAPPGTLRDTDEPRAGWEWPQAPQLLAMPTVLAAGPLCGRV